MKAHKDAVIWTFGAWGKWAFGVTTTGPKWVNAYGPLSNYAISGSQYGVEKTPRFKIVIDVPGGATQKYTNTEVPWQASKDPLIRGLALPGWVWVKHLIRHERLCIGVD